MLLRNYGTFHKQLKVKSCFKIILHLNHIVASLFSCALISSTINIITVRNILFSTCLRWKCEAYLLKLPHLNITLTMDICMIER